MNKRYIFFIFILVPFWITAQDVLQKNLNYNFVNTPLDEFIRSIEDQAEVKFFYKQDWIEKTQISLKGDDITLFDALNKAFKYTKFSFIFREPNFIR